MLQRFRWFVIAFSMVLALAPFAGVFLAALLALVLGCEINDAAQGACAGAAFDARNVLASLTATRDLGHITVPVVAGLLAIWGLVELAAWLLRSWRSA